MSEKFPTWEINTLANGYLVRERRRPDGQYTDMGTEWWIARNVDDIAEILRNHLSVPGDPS